MIYQTFKMHSSMQISCVLLVQNQSYCFAVKIDQGASSPNYKVA